MSRQRLRHFVRILFSWRLFMRQGQILALHYVIAVLLSPYRVHLLIVLPPQKQWQGEVVTPQRFFNVLVSQHHVPHELCSVKKRLHDPRASKMGLMWLHKSTTFVLSVAHNDKFVY